MLKMSSVTVRGMKISGYVWGSKSRGARPKDIPPTLIPMGETQQLMPLPIFLISDS